MQILGLYFKRISAERPLEFKGKFGISTNIQFLDLEKEKSELLKGKDLIKLSFTFSVLYGSDEKEKKEVNGKVEIDGVLMLSPEEKEAKEMTKSWKKHEVPKEYIVPFYNYILKRSSVRALQLEDDIGLPPHIPFPQVRRAEEQK